MRNIHIRQLLSLVLVLALCTAAALTCAEESEKSFSLIESASRTDALSITEIVKKTRTSIVAIETERTVVYNNSDYYNPFGMFGFGYGFDGGRGNGGRQKYTQRGAGSGIIISEDGYILTNNHVISGADKITVYVRQDAVGKDEETYEATLIGASESNDIAVLKIEATGLNAASFGDSDNLEIGELAVVIGNPMGVVHGSVTAGIISDTERELTIDGITINAIQTDAAINPGNSGGALFDSFGNVVGVIYARSSATYDGIGYAIPVNTIKPLIDAMINHTGEVDAQTKGSQIMLGISIQDVTEELSKMYSMPMGVYIREVSEMSAAERAGLTRGDIITGFAGKPVVTADDLNAIKAEQTPGDIVPIVVDRNGHELQLDIVIPQPTEIVSEK